MTAEEAGERYQIPAELLSDYEQWRPAWDGEQRYGNRPYDDGDIARLSMMLTLRDVGFDRDGVRQYMELFLAARNTAPERLQLLRALREQVVDDIHVRQKQLDRLDYLRYQIQQGKEPVLTT
ncbi:MerR family transcriptional regulator [uncultured Megasphaera sp.]|uniref:MerR family transcriptional regulator n=1 Tax=uncultured Megasphaera sp. TaxID=165188 RepID=UPI0026596390|nr:MerR family transcriptional regulator [uncultured Megasphaera sp.]